MQADTPESTVSQLVHAAVVARLDGDPSLAQQLTTLPTTTVDVVLRRLQATSEAGDTATTTPSGPSAQEKVEQLTLWVTGELGRGELSHAQAETIADHVGKHPKMSVDRLKFVLQMDINAWKKYPNPKAELTRRRNRQGLAAMTGVDDVRSGYVAMGKEKLDGSPLLWTGGLAGCLGVVIVNGGTCLLAHYQPDHINPASKNGEPSILDIRMGMLATSIDLAGASYWLASNVAGVGYYRAFQAAMASHQATLVGEFNATTIAIRTADQQVFADFSPPEGMGED
jgi:hypothetical protein